VLGINEFSYVADTDYNALGRVDQIEFYTGLYSNKGARVFQSFEHELETGLLKGSRVDRELISPYTVANFRYDYNKAGEITKIADVAAPGGADNQCFRDDFAGRLVEAWTPASGDCSQPVTPAALGGPAKYWLSWEVDQAGRRLTQVDHTAAGGERTTRYEYPDAKQPFTHALSGTSTTVGTGAAVHASYTYDAAGNTQTRPTASAGTQTLTWDPEGRLESTADATGTTTYLYDADGNRLISRDSKGKTLFLPGQEVRFTSATAARVCTRFYSFLGKTIGSRTATGLSWVFADTQGTATVAVDEVTQQAKVRRQTPFGELRGAAPAWPNNKGFVGGTTDGTGLTHLGAREYDAAIGRFVSVDPVFTADDPSQLNPYSYAGNNPVDDTDPSGLSSSGSWTYVGGRSATWTQDGYKYHYTERYYMFCRYGGSVCLGVFKGTFYWMPVMLAGPAFRFIARVVTTLWRERIPFIGPVALPKRQFTVTQQPQLPSCPPPPPPRPEPLDEIDGLPKCGFFDWDCVKGKDGLKKWWRGNRDWVTGGAAVIGTVTCIAATAGVCAVAGVAGLGVGLTGRVLDVASSRSGWTEDNVARMGWGMAFDVGSYFLVPGVRNFRVTGGGNKIPVAGRSALNPAKYKSQTWKEQFTYSDGSINPTAVKSGLGNTGAQLAWCSVSCPSGVVGYDIPFTDPMGW